MKVNWYLLQFKNKDRIELAECYLQSSLGESAASVRDSPFFTGEHSRPYPESSCLFSINTVR